MIWQLLWHGSFYTAWVRARLRKLHKRCTRLTAASDTVYQSLAHGRCFPQGTPVSSITKTGRHDIAEIFLKVALTTINQIKSRFYILCIMLKIIAFLIITLFALVYVCVYTFHCGKIHYSKRWYLGPLFIVVTVPRHESGGRLCVRCIILASCYDFDIWFLKSFDRVVLFAFRFLIITHVDVPYDSRNPYRLGMKMLKDF
jgi:hypothetical protein